MYTAASKTSVLGMSDAAMREAPTATETHALHLARATRIHTFRHTNLP